MMTNQKNGTLYIGVTANLRKRIYEHRAQVVHGFTRRYGLKLLVYYELHASIVEAIHREKRLKKYTRENKIKLIKSLNPEWHDLWPEIAIA
jgi:putative endonuclease